LIEISWNKEKCELIIFHFFGKNKRNPIIKR